MKKLSETWFMEGNIDFESKKYTLLAYLQRINRAFDENKLYPPLADLIFHFQNLQSFRHKKQLLQSQFPKKLTGIQLEKIQLIYEEMVADNELMSEIEGIVQFALQQIESTVSAGTHLYDYVENKLEITPVGILPFHNDEGYFFLTDGQAKSIRVYEYQLSIFERPNDRYRSLRSHFVQEWSRNFVNTYQSIKGELLKFRKKIGLPAFYAIQTNLAFPMEETLLPVAKRCLVRHLAKDNREIN